MTTPEAHRASLREALLTGRLTRGHLVEAMIDVKAAGLLDADKIRPFSKQDRVLTNNLALTFANLVGIVQDQIIRLVLLLEEEDDEVAGTTRREQRLRAEAIGVIGSDRHFERVASARNRIAHQYPRDPDKQKRLLNDIAEQSESAVAAFDDVWTYALRAFFDGRLDE